MSEPTRQVLDAVALFAWLPLIAIAIPLLIASLLAMPGLRTAAASVAAWAAAPALLIAVSAPDTGLALPAVLLGSSLELDATGRPFLFAVAVLWLTAGVLGRAGLQSTGTALLYLLAMSGTFAMALAGDLLLFLLGSTVSGYALYGLLGGRGGAQILVRLLVLSDLMLFEALLLLVYAGNGLEFASLPQSLAAAKDNGLLLMMLFLIGFGAKAGLLGVHYWLAPSISSARPEQRLALMAFVLTAGLLPWTRLLAPGAIDWPEAAAPLQWLALAMAGFALVVGLVQRCLGALAGYGVMAMSALWLGLLGAAMSGSVVAAAAAKLATAIAQSGLALSALLLIVTPTSPGRWRWLRPATAAVGALLLVDAVLTALAPFAPDSHPSAPAVSVLALICAAAGLLLGRTLYLALSPAQSSEAEAEAEAEAVPAALLLILAAALVAVGYSGGMDAPWLEGAAVLLGGVVGALFEPLVRRRSSLPLGRAGKPIMALLGATAQRIQHGLITPLGHWRTQKRSLVASVFSTRVLQRGLAPAEAALRIWRIAIVLVLMTGAIAALVLLIKSP